MGAGPGDGAGAGVAEAIPFNEAGLDLLAKGRAVEAVRAFRAARVRSPESSILRRNLAAALAAVAGLRRAKRKPVEAVELLDEAVRLHPERLRYRWLRGCARFEAARAADFFFARNDFRFVLERDPDQVVALRYLGQIAYLERRLDEAIRLWRRARALQPDDPQLAARLERAERERRVEAAFETLEDRTFRLRYAPEVSRSRAGRMLQICEEAYGDLSRKFDTYPERIVVILYTPQQFRSALRVHAWVAGVSDGTIRIAVPAGGGEQRLRATLYHELTHHLVRGVAPRAPPWLQEGLAQLAEGKSAAAAASRLRRGRMPPESSLSIGVLQTSDPRIVAGFYDLALAFTSYLQSLQGDAGITRLLGELGRGTGMGEALRAVFGASRSTLFARWAERLRTGR